jgi:uncharacterized cofD-like protein
MKIVGIGGGTGLPVLLRGMVEIGNGRAPADVTAIVTVSDSGGSTGVLRSAFNMPAMGDIRKCLISLAAKDSVLTAVCQHRFDNPENFAGHSLGNLILSALYQMSGNFTAAVDRASELLGLTGRVLPSTEVPVTLCALYDDGTTAEGESNIPRTGLGIRRVWLEPSNPMPAPGVLEAIENADAIVMGPGSLYTSIIPNLLVGRVREALKNSRAIKIYICNLMTQPGETSGYSAADHVRAVLDYAPGSIDVCVLNSSLIGTEVAHRYLDSGAELVTVSLEDEDRIRRCGVVPVVAPLLSDGQIKARHESATLARLVMSLARGFAGVQEIICGQGNGR